MGLHHHQVIDGVDVYLKSAVAHIEGDEHTGPIEITRVVRFEQISRVDLELPTGVVDSYRVWKEPPVPQELLDDITAVGIREPLRLFTDGVHAVLRDGHHRLVVAKQLGLATLPVHVMPNHLGGVYDDVTLTPIDELLARWLEANEFDFNHSSHTYHKAPMSPRAIQVACSCGASWWERAAPELASYPNERGEDLP